MGDAYTAVADDEMTLFYNPAALGRHTGVTIIPLKPNIGFPDILDKELSLDNFKVGVSNRFQNFPSEPEAISDKVLGFPLYLEIGAAPTVKVMNFGFNFFTVSKTSMELKNAIHPVLDLNYRLDRGFIVGYAFNHGSGGQGANPEGSSFSTGIGFKSVNRQGLENDFDLFGTYLLSVLQNASSYQDIRRELGYSKGSGYGFDLGTEYNFRSGATRYTVGLSWLDIGDTSFPREDGIYHVPDQKQSLNLGSSFNQDFGWADYTLALDYSNIIDSQSAFSSKIKFGGRLRLPLLSIYTGWNGGYASMGLGVRFLFMDFKVGFYGVELGRKFRQNEGKRTVISLSIAEISLDAF